MRPGEVSVITGGQTTTVSVVVENTTDLVVRGEDFEIRLIAECTQGCPITLDESSRQMLRLEREGTVRISGSGFLPGSSVIVWLFSEPRRLGEVLVGEDGTFSASLPIGALAPGMHTVQVNGISMDNTLRTANLGVVVDANSDSPEPGILPVTGADLSMQATQMMLLALLLLGLGLVLQASCRRPSPVAGAGSAGSARQSLRLIDHPSQFEAIQRPVRVGRTERPRPAP
jgi:hypothetical protein